jgi:hypothetical protein
MVVHSRQTQTTQEYMAWEGLIRAACASAASQQPGAIRAVTVSHRADQLSSSELEAVLGFARGLAHDKGLYVETEESTRRLLLRFSRQPAADEASVEAEPFGPGIKALWRRLVWQRRE